MIHRFADRRFDPRAHAIFKIQPVDRHDLRRAGSGVRAIVGSSSRTSSRAIPGCLFERAQRELGRVAKTGNFW
jgi:hypothetical protein